MDKGISYMIANLENRLLEEIYSILDKNDEEEMDVQFKVGNVTYETINICRDDNGKVESAEVVSSYLEDDGLVYSDTTQLTRLGLSVLIEILKALEK